MDIANSDIEIIFNPNGIQKVTANNATKEAMVVDGFGRSFILLFRYRNRISKR